MLGRASVLCTISLSCATMAGGRPLGPASAYQALTSKSGSRVSATLGMLGNSAKRFFEVTASGLTLPFSMWAAMPASEVKSNGTSPAITASAGALPPL